MTTYMPQPGVVLVKLSASEYGDIPVPEKQHDTQTSGVVVNMNPSDEKEYGQLLECTVYFQKYMDDARVFDGNKFVFIKIADILGYSYDDSNNSN